ncbi:MULTISPECIES: hypothetical protein [Proteiniphilum]|jgi:hypothetical protein|uniref:hypothetical protein n=1 Tax=Proteiniphilum TaxID=294702 RepID=UPI001EEC2C9F|nr:MULTISPECIES: hypothetical protein [Proteiniphilum]ULB33598.1 hypothetical protein KDN43_11325 [Proteiniphilum propionicum]
MRAIKFLVSKGVFLIILLISCVNNEVVGQIEKENIVLNPDDKKKSSLRTIQILYNPIHLNDGIFVR